jgi:hypothetical protein
MTIKIFISFTIFILFVSVAAADTNSSGSNVFQHAATSANSSLNGETNLVSYFQDIQLVNVNQMLATNGMNCVLTILDEPDWQGKPPYCLVSIYNHSTNFIGCLRMSEASLCRVALLDRQDHQIQKTSLGKMYGLPLPEDQIEQWQKDWNNRHQSIRIRITPNEIPKYADIPTDICTFSVKDAFEIKEAGEYELHLQMRLVQVGKDSSGKLHYPVTWLPEVAIKVHITQEDLH